MPLVRDLIYFDIDKASSLLSQFEGGLPGETQEKTEAKKDERNLRKYDIPLFKPEFGGITTDTQSQMQTRVLHHDLIQRLEHHLFNANRGLEINQAFEEVPDDISAIHDKVAAATYLKATGWAILEDFERLKTMAAKFNQLAEFFGRCAMANLEQNEEYSRLMVELDAARKQATKQKDRNKKVPQLQQLKKLEEQMRAAVQQQIGGQKLDDWLLEGIGFFIDFFMPGRILLTVYPFQNHRDFHVLSNLKRDCFVDGDLNTVLQAYGNRPNLQLSVLGLVTSVPPDGENPFDPFGGDNSETVPEGRAFEHGFRSIFRQMDELFKFTNYSRYPNVTVHPLAVFRELGETAS